MSLRRYWVKIDKEKIMFFRPYDNPQGIVRTYKATPERVWRVLCASGPYTHYKG